MKAFSLRPAYAETHFKFRLPGSRLFQDEPELLVDTAAQVVPGAPCVFYLVAREADRFPVFMKRVEGYWQDPNGIRVPFLLPCEQYLDQPFHFLPLTCPSPPAPGIWLAHTTLFYERSGSFRVKERWNYPHLPPQPLLVRFLASPPPRPDGWIAGETHCHSWHSSDPVEYGAPPSVLQQAALARGLDFICITDHSYDFAWRKDAYQQAADPVRRYADLQAETLALPSYPLVLAGEEVSCANARGENVHMLVPGAPSYLPGQGDGGRRWFHNRPDLDIASILALTPGPCFAAHPKVPMGSLERRVFRRGGWDIPDLHLEKERRLAGLQFWNGARDQGFYAGRAFWIDQLLRGHRLLPLGGSDAHGDLNDCTGVRLPLWSLKHSRHHVFGQVHTVLPHAGKPSPASLLRALSGDRLYATEGPALWWEPGEKGPLLQALSSKDFGALRSVRLFYASPGAKEESMVELMEAPSFSGHWETSSRHEACYLRAECETVQGLFALTSAYFLDD